MFIDYGIFIIGFVLVKYYLSVLFEEIGIVYFNDDIVQVGYSVIKGLF